jgi:hypothetical protein
MRSDHQRRLSALESRVGQRAHEAAIQAQREWTARTAPLRIARLVAEVNGEDPNLIEIPPYEGQWVHVHDPEAERALAAIRGFIEEAVRSHKAKLAYPERHQKHEWVLEEAPEVPEWAKLSEEQQRLVSSQAPAVERAVERPVESKAPAPEPPAAALQAPVSPKAPVNSRRRRAHPFAELGGCDGGICPAYR